MIPAAKDIYTSSCAWPPQDIWPPEAALMSELALCARCDVPREMRQNEMIRPVALLGCI